MTSENEFFCTEIAWKFGVPLLGTATRGDIWFLIEYSGRWEAKAFEQSEIPDALKARILAIQNLDKRVRTLLVRQPGSRQKPRIALFVGQTKPLDPRLYEYHFEDYLEISNLDLEALAAGEPGDPSALRTEPLYLVCTNGRRDRCCSIYGPEVYQAMSEQAGESVWQSSHIGGHNQSPILLFFPYGVNYARATPAEASRLVQAYRRNEVVLHHYRGRVCYQPQVQAAEHFWREQTGDVSLPGIQVNAVAEVKPNQWVVDLTNLATGETGAIRLERRESGFKIRVACSSDKEQPVQTFHRVSDS